MLACIFFLLSFLFYSQAINIHSNYSSAYIFLSIILGFFSMLSKEQGITVLGVCGAYDVLAHWKSLSNMCCKMFKKGKEKFEIQSDCRDVIKRLCASIILLKLWRHLFCRFYCIFWGHHDVVQDINE